MTLIPLLPGPRVLASSVGRAWNGIEAALLLIPRGKAERPGGPDHVLGMHVFHEVEAQFRQFDGQRLILRSAEHMHNWARSISTALENGILPSFQNPVDKPQPTISAQDLGIIAANLLCRIGSAGELEVIHAEGPLRYSAADVAGVLSELSGRQIQPQPVPRDQWASLLGRAMPPNLADLLIRTNDAKNMAGLVDVEPGSDAVLYGTTKLIDALRPLLMPRPHPC